MQTKTLLISALLPFIATATVASNLNNKHLAGPPEEFDFMQKAQPHLSAITSKSAMLPITLAETKSGNWIWESNISVDSENFSFMVFSNGAKNWNIELTHPVTREVRDASQFAVRQETAKFGIERNQYPGEKFTFNNMDMGEWQVSIRTDGEEPDQFNGFLLVSNKSPYQLRSYKTNSDQIVDHRIHFVTEATSNEDTIEVLKKFNPVQSAFMLVTHPDGIQSRVEMFDDGLHGDKEANDGLFGGDFLAKKAGGYNVQIHAKGYNPNATTFYRTSEHFVPVIEQSIRLNTDKATGFAMNDKRLNVSLNLDTEKSKSDDRYRIIAEVWGNSTSKKGEMVPVSWVSTINEIENGELNVELDSRWISMAKAQAPFELRNLRIEDANHFIPLVEANSMDLKIASLPKFADKAFDGYIDEEMLMGVRPQNISQKGTGSKLLLVHGYCSGDAWGPVQYQFSNSAVFQDFNQNRSHDQFANLIKNFGSQYNSFGVVAHSQGGAASMHLYTYYWSGLDYSSGSRLIQSVGTPYQGTPLAGNLAAIGDVFGAGCGTNSNLTTSGAASWLSGIPTWARNQVHYFTTSFTTKWWRYDYCHLATDLFLSDPEDGTTEKSRGQLSGANNKGHKTGWCHTSGMRDPAQTRDSSRNYSMSSYAKR